MIYTVLLSDRKHVGHARGALDICAKVCPAAGGATLAVSQALYQHCTVCLGMAKM